jgi:cyclin B
MEREMLRVIGFDLGIPLSYSFLRRYGRVIKAPMPLLTTARFYLELSLHYLKFCVESESKMAAACMLLALRVTKSGDWNAILEKYSTYKLADIEQLAIEINHMVKRFPIEYKSLKSVFEKYSHPYVIFYIVQNILI